MSVDTIMGKYIGGSINETVLNGEEVAKELGLTRPRIKQITSNAMPKVFKAFQDLYPDSSPFQVLMIVAQALQCQNDRDGLVTIVRNISKEQKAKVISDIETQYPQYKKAIADMGIK